MATIENMNNTIEKNSALSEINDKAKTLEGEKVGRWIKTEYTIRKETNEKKEKTITDKELATLEHSNKLGSEAKKRSDENNIPNMDALLNRKGYPQG